MKGKIILFPGTDQYDAAMKIVKDNNGTITARNGIGFININDRVGNGFSKRSLRDITTRRNKIKDRLQRKLANRT